MGLLRWLLGLVGLGKPRLSVADLARRLAMAEEDLRLVEPAYREFTIPKRSGGVRRIHAPEATLKAVQRRILRAVLVPLRCHPAVHGFEKGRSIVTNAVKHVGREVVIRLDIQDFFPSISLKRVSQFFRNHGWNREAANLLTRLCTHEGGLPQGPPTSPRLANLVNYRLDARLHGLAVAHSGKVKTRNPRSGQLLDRPTGIGEATYTRYADDLTFSFTSGDAWLVRGVLWFARHIVEDEGYRLHLRRKLRIRRRHERQAVTGLVVNQRVNLPRETKRRLRAVEHHIRTGRPATLTREQLAGWRGLEVMVEKQGKV